MPDTHAPDTLLGRAHDDRYLALARTLARPVQPAPLDEAAILARLEAIEARFGNGAMVSMCIRTGSDAHRVGVTVLDAQYNIIAQTTAATFAAALDAMERDAAALRDGVA
jgi:hypothetical protein